MAASKEHAKKYLSHALAEWVASLNYEHLSPAAIQSAKLFWFDSVGCALGGSQQSDAKILLDHYREMAGLPVGAGSPRPESAVETSNKGRETPPLQDKGTGPCSTFVSNLRTNPADAAFLNSHMIRAMDYNDIYWKADPAHPSDILGGPLAIAEMKKL